MNNTIGSDIRQIISLLESANNEMANALLNYDCKDLQRLIDLGTDLNQEIEFNDQKMPPLQFAMLAGNQKAIGMLLDAGAEKPTGSDSNENVEIWYQPAVRQLPHFEVVRKAVEWGYGYWKLQRGMVVDVHSLNIGGASYDPSRNVISIPKSGTDKNLCKAIFHELTHAKQYERFELEWHHLQGDTAASHQAMNRYEEIMKVGIESAALIRWNGEGGPRQFLMCKHDVSGLQAYEIMQGETFDNDVDAILSRKPILDDLNLSRKMSIHKYKTMLPWEKEAYHYMDVMWQEYSKLK